MRVYETRAIADPMTIRRDKILFICRIAFILIANPLNGGTPARLKREIEKLGEVLFM